VRLTPLAKLIISIFGIFDIISISGIIDIFSIIGIIIFVL